MYRKSWLIIVLFLLAGIGLSYSQSGNRNLYRDQIDEKIKAELKKSWSKKKTPGYVLDKVDQQCFQNGEEDRRVLAMLGELTKSRKHILAVRVESGYNTFQAISRESDPGWTNYSPHGKGRAQAFDIFYADKVEIGWQVSPDANKRKKAQAKIRELLKEILAIGSRQSDLLPTQLCVYRRDDIMAFSREANKLYGGYPPATGLMGMMTGDRYWDRIHVGY